MEISSLPDGPGLHHSSPMTYSQSVSHEISVSETAAVSANHVSSSVCEVKDGEIIVELPQELLEDSKPLWSKFIAGYFIGDAPHIGKVHATVNRLWSSAEENSMIDAQFLSPKTVLFRIENDQMRQRVLRRHFWHIADIPLVVREWSPSTMDSKPDLTMIPLWVDLQNVPDSLFSEKGLKFLGDKIGSMQRLHPKTARCVRLDVARMLVVVNLEKPLPNRINLVGMDSVIQVSYPWLPSRCSTCQEWGHGEKECVRMKKGADVESTHKTDSSFKEPVLKWIPKASESAIVNEGVDIGVNEVVEDESTWSLVKKNSRQSPSRPATVAVAESNGSPSVFQVLNDIHEEGEYTPEESEEQKNPPVEEPQTEDQRDVNSQDEAATRSHKPKSQRHRSCSRSTQHVGQKDSKHIAPTHTSKKASSGKH